MENPSRDYKVVINGKVFFVYHNSEREAIQTARMRFYQCSSKNLPIGLHEEIHVYC